MDLGHDKHSVIQSTAMKQILPVDELDICHFLSKLYIIFLSKILGVANVFVLRCNNYILLYTDMKIYNKYIIFIK